ncbi:MAG: 2-isopropylmalate synthase [Candidatus Aminicenantes bacterium]|nr:2-isopropylmalate synthase [Candidatus Aminicenantes bacterium]
MIKILDTTLREGEQTPGVYFDLHIKTAIAEMLDRIGVDIIEAGHPAVSVDIKNAIVQISSLGTKAKIGAHARSVKKDIDLALDCGVNFLGVFFCVADERLNHIDQNLHQAVDNISRIIAYAKEKKPGLKIRYTPEDTVRSKWENVISASAEAVRAGADIISVADTTGYMIPGTDRSFYTYIHRLRSELGKQNLFPLIAVHCHNDRGLALANALDSYRAGADIIDASVMGFGERAGIVDLASLLAVLHSDFDESSSWELDLLPDLYKCVSHYSGIPVPVHFPVTGKNAFTHCAGIHTQAALKNPIHYQSLSPGLFGRQTEITLDHMSGRATIAYALEKIGIQCPSNELIYSVLAKVKEVGRLGRTVDLDELKYIVRLLNPNQYPEFLL